MRKIAFIVCIVLMFSACNNTKSNKAENETNNVRKTEQKEVTASLKEVTLSFKDIEIGKNIDKINSSCFKNDGKIKIKSFELISDFVCSAEKLQKTFFASIVAGYDNNKYTGKVLVYTEKGKKEVTKIVYYVPITSYNTYPDIYTLYEDKYGNPTTDKKVLQTPFEKNFSTWVFANNMRLTIAKREYTGDSYGPFQEIARIGRMKDCVEVVYCDYSLQIKENKIKAEAKRKAIEEREKKNELAKKEKERQDI